MNERKKMGQGKGQKKENGTEKRTKERKIGNENGLQKENETEKWT